MTPPPVAFVPELPYNQRNPSTRPRTRLLAKRVTNGQIVLTGLAVTNRVNPTEPSTKLSQPFAFLGNVIRDSSDAFAFEDQAANTFPQRFYRLNFP